MIRKIIIIVVLSAAGCMAARAQDKEPAPQVQFQNSPAGTAQARGSDSVVIPELLFEGGTVRELLERMQLAAKSVNHDPSPLNIIVAPEMQDSEVPRFELHNVTYADVFQALNRLNTDFKGSEWTLTGQHVWVLNAPRAEPGINPLTGQPTRARMSQIYQLQRYLGKYNIEDITTAIQTTWTMMDQEKGTQLKYHKDTSLLIAVGNVDQLQVITQVLQSLNEGLAISTPAKSEKGEVFVNGAVNKAGTVLVTGEQELNILGVIARAGGLTQRANENKIRFTRPGVMEKTFTLDELKKNPKSNITVQPGDIVEIAEKLF